MSIKELYRVGQGGGITHLSGNEKVSDPLKLKGGDATKLTGSGEFQALLSREQDKVQRSLTLSSHAETRIRSRDIPWNPQIETRISKGLDQAESKGSREALILADNVAVIANVKSRTVVTAMDRNQMRERIFTNIDSAVIV